VQQSKQFTVTPETREVRCGDVIRADAVLTKDLHCTGDVGLRIAAGDVVLDLGGHKIATDDPTAARTGVVVAATETIRNVTIRNGSITQFRTGVEMTDVSDVTIANATVSGSPETVWEDFFGIVGERARNVQIRSSTLGGFNPFSFEQESSVVFAASSIVGDIGLGFAFCDNSSCLFQTGNDIQVRYLGCSGDMPDKAAIRIDRSTVVFVEWFGAGCGETSVTNNVVKGLINVDGVRNLVANNRMDKNPTMIVRGNFVVSDNEFIGAVSKGLQIEEDMTGLKGEVVGNRFIGNGGYGLRVVQYISDVPAGPLKISGNQFISNGLNPEYPEYGRDGLRVDELGPGGHVEVSDNRAENNGEYGMYAEPGTVTVDVRNTASGNPRGCFVIAC
jgi:hypothetical protein